MVACVYSGVRCHVPCDRHELPAPDELMSGRKQVDDSSSRLVKDECDTVASSPAGTITMPLEASQQSDRDVLLLPSMQSEAVAAATSSPNAMDRSVSIQSGCPSRPQHRGLRLQH